MFVMRTLYNFNLPFISGVQLRQKTSVVGALAVAENTPSYLFVSLNWALYGWNMALSAILW